jgi:hypothetical protein
VPQHDRRPDAQRGRSAGWSATGSLPSVAMAGFSSSVLARVSDTDVREAGQAEAAAFARLRPFGGVYVKQKVLAGEHGAQMRDLTPHGIPTASGRIAEPHLPE